jgi:serine protease Do
MDFAALADDLRRITVELTNGDEFAGSGVVWAPGWVVTNAHVARRPRVRLRLADGRRPEGRLVARDGDADLALLRVPALDLRPPTLAGPDALRVGSLIVAVGHPLGVRGALTAGVIHAIGPIVRGGRSWIQADLRLAPGNSGGPLADARGYVLGVNAMVAGSLALAIPAPEVTRFVRAAGIEPT